MDQLGISRNILVHKQIGTIYIYADLRKYLMSSNIISSNIFLSLTPII